MAARWRSTSVAMSRAVLSWSARAVRRDWTRPACRSRWRCVPVGVSATRTERLSPTGRRRVTWPALTGPLTSWVVAALVVSVAVASWVTVSGLPLRRRVGRTRPGRSAGRARPRRAPLRAPRRPHHRRHRQPDLVARRRPRPGVTRRAPGAPGPGGRPPGPPGDRQETVKNPADHVRRASGVAAGTPPVLHSGARGAGSWGAARRRGCSRRW